MSPGKRAIPPIVSLNATKCSRTRGLPVTKPFSSLALKPLLARYRCAESATVIRTLASIHISDQQLQTGAKTIANIYKVRWQIELFFKCIRQNLKIKSFIGTSLNAVLTQIWVAMCTYLLLTWIKFSSQISGSFQRIIRLLQFNLFDRRDLLSLPKGDPPEPPDNPLQGKLRLV